MQYIPCNSALLAQEALFLPKKALFMPKDLQKKVRKSQQNSVCSGLKFSSESKLFGGGPLCPRALLPPWSVGNPNQKHSYTSAAEESG